MPDTIISPQARVWNIGRHKIAEAECSNKGPSKYSFDESFSKSLMFFSCHDSGGLFSFRYYYHNQSTLFKAGFEVEY